MVSQMVDLRKGLWPMQSALSNRACLAQLPVKLEEAAACVSGGDRNAVASHVLLGEGV